MINQKFHYRVVDTSFTSNTCKAGKEKEWNLALESISKVLPDFETTPYKTCVTSLWLLEHIGLGQFREQNKANLTIKKSYLDFLNEHNYDYELAAHSMINAVRLQVEKFYRDKLSARFLSHTAIKSVQKFPYHHLAVSIKTEIKMFRNNLENHDYYNFLIWDLVGDTLLRYPYVSIRNISKEMSSIAANFYSHVYHKLAKTYISYRQDKKYNFSGFGLFHSIQDFWNLILDPNTSKSSLLRTWDDMVDSELIHFANLGWFENGNLHPVLVITCENNRKISERIQIHKDTISNLNALGYSLESKKGCIINLIPENNFKAEVHIFN
jgi:hypothetical protein